MHFGLRNSGSTFQCLMHQVLGHLPFCFNYVDDLLTACESEAEHLEQLRTVFTLLHANHLVIKERSSSVVGFGLVSRYLGRRRQNWRRTCRQFSPDILKRRCTYLIIGPPKRSTPDHPLFTGFTSCFHS